MRYEKKTISVKNNNIQDEKNQAKERKLLISTKDPDYLQKKKTVNKIISIFTHANSYDRSNYILTN